MMLDVLQWHALDVVDLMVNRQPSKVSHNSDGPATSRYPAKLTLQALQRVAMRVTGLRSVTSGRGATVLSLARTAAFFAFLAGK